MVNTPVLFITFARPEYASQSFAQIKAAKPRKLYFYSNKAREEKIDEVKRNQEVRSYLKQIDWECDVKTWFREEYVDVFTSIWGAVDWVFDNEKQAIVIEEDVVTCPAFWQYMDYMVEKFKDNKKVWMISGDNASPEYNQGDVSYFATRFAEIYGWASWSDRWHSLDREMLKWPEFSKTTEYNSYWNTWLQRNIQKYWFQQVYIKKPDYNPWDYIFNYNMCMNNGCCLIPAVNLVSDIGLTGANHSQAIESTLKVPCDGYQIDLSKAPENLEFTSFDNLFFMKNKFWPLLYRKFRRILHL